MTCVIQGESLKCIRTSPNLSVRKLESLAYYAPLGSVRSTHHRRYSSAHATALRSRLNSELTKSSSRLQDFLSERRDVYFICIMSDWWSVSKQRTSPSKLIKERQTLDLRVASNVSTYFSEPLLATGLPYQRPP